MSMRQLKYHEKKLLKKVDFLRWQREHNLRELQVYIRLRLRAEEYSTASCLTSF